MKKYLLIILLLSLNSFSQENKIFNYECGIGFEYNELLTKTKNQKVNYFTSNYTNGICSSILFKNRVWLNKLYFSLDGGLGLMYQKQNFVFSNVLDPIIEFNVSYKKILWQFNAGLGKTFNLSNNLNLNIELGTTVNDFFRVHPNDPVINSSFTVDYVKTDGFYVESSKSRVYDYSINLNGVPIMSQWVKISILKEFSKRKLEFGITYTNNRLKYYNFITLKSTNYTAISSSRSKSNAFGVYFNLFFNNK